MANNRKNIIVGAAALYVSVKNSADDTDFFGVNGNVAVTLPTLTASTPAGAAFEAATTTWRSVGFTSDGIELSYDPTYGEVEVDQLLDAAVMFKSGMKASVKTALAEATLTNLLVAWGQKSSSLGADSTEQELGIEGGALYEEPVERSVVFIGPSPRSSTGIKRERLYHLRRALNVEATALSLKKTDATNIPVSLRLLADSYYSGKEYGIIRDRNVAAA
jgi:hypothetical protein